MTNPQNTYIRHCKKCNEIFKPSSKYSFMCDNCKKSSRMEGCKKSKITQTGKKIWPNKIKKQHRLTRIEESVTELEIEITRLRDLKEKGKFNLQNAEYALKRLATKIINLYK